MNPIARLRAWYSDPDQFIARAEVAWFLRWLRGRGGAWVAALFMMQILHHAAFVLMARHTSPPSPNLMSPKSVMFLRYFYALLPLVIAAWLTHRRSLAPFRPGRIESLRLTPVRPHHLWPGLIAAPFLFLLGWGVLRGMLFQIIDHFNPLLQPTYQYATSFDCAWLGEPDSIPNLLLYFSFHLFYFAYRQLFVLMLSFAGALAYVLFSIRVQMPRGGFAGTVASMWLLWFLVMEFPGRTLVLLLLTRATQLGLNSLVIMKGYEIAILLALSMIALWSLRWLRSEAGFGKALGKE